MNDINRELKILLRDLDEEFHKLNHVQQEKFAFEQIKIWLGKLNKIETDLPDKKSIDSVF